MSSRRRPCRRALAPYESSVVESPEPTDAPWASPADAVLEALDVRLDAGLSDPDVHRRRAAHGKNRLRRVDSRGALDILVAQLKSAILLLLAVGAVLSFAFGQLVEGAAIVAVIVLNTAIGFVTELRAVRSMEALRELGEVERHRAARGHPAAACRPPSSCPATWCSSKPATWSPPTSAWSTRRARGRRVLAHRRVGPGRQADRARRDGRAARRAHVHALQGHHRHARRGRGRRRRHRDAHRARADLRAVEEAEDQTTPLEKRLETARPPAHGRLPRVRRARRRRSASSAARPVPDDRVRHRARGGHRARGPPRRRHRRPRPWHVADGAPERARRAARRGRDARLHEPDPHRQDGHPHREPDARNPALWFTARRSICVGTRRAVGGAPLDAESHALLELALRVAVEASEATAPSADGGAIGDPMEVALVAAGERIGLRRAALLREEPEHARDRVRPADVKMSATEHRRGDRVRVAVKGAPEAVLRACTRVTTAGGARPARRRGPSRLARRQPPRGRRRPPRDRHRGARARSAAGRRPRLRRPRPARSRRSARSPARVGRVRARGVPTGRASEW